MLFETCRRVGSRHNSLKGRQKKTYLGSMTQLTIKEGETKDIREMEREIQAGKELVEEWKQKAEEWKENCEDLETRMAELYISMEAEVENEKENLEKATQSIKDLHGRAKEYCSLANSGKMIDDVGIRQQQRKLGEISTRSQKALWFAETFGLVPDSITFKTKKSKKTVTVAYDSEGHAATATMSKNSHPVPDLQPSVDEPPPKPHNNVERFLALPDPEKDKVMQILFLLDHFSGSDALYHEFTQLFPSMPRSYLVWAYRSMLNKSFNVQALEAPHDGATIPLIPMLISDICAHMDKNGIEDPEGKKFKIKICGDGARFSRSSTFLLLSYALIENDKELLTSAGHRTFAALKAPEQYHELKVALKDVWAAINGLMETEYVTIDGKKVGLEIYFSGDYKFMLMVMGMKNATADYACLWCHVHKNNRHDMDKPEHFYNGGNMKRTKKSMEECLKKRSTEDKKGCEFEPLLKVEPDHCILDELHLLLRIMDRLLENVIEAALQRDEKRGRITSCQKIGTNLKALESAIKECGVAFRFWQKKGDDGSRKGLDWTSLMGRDKKKLLDRLPEKMHTFLPESHAEEVKLIWEVN